jgi:TnpA family transposase
VARLTQRWNAFCYVGENGQGGEISKRHREGQDDQLGALGLLTTTVVLWNALYMYICRKH